MRPIYKKNFFYTLIKTYAKFCFDHSYRRTEIYGEENIPSEGAIIFAPNHTNALTDALSVLFIGRTDKVFAAKAGIFGNPFIASALRFFKILPINRIRDGIRNMGKNKKTFLAASDVLQHGIPFVIFPEGTQQYAHSMILPLQKGIFRIALQSLGITGESVGENTKIGDLEFPFQLSIVPTGIEYGRFSAYRTYKLIRIGQPIEITGFIRSLGEDRIFNMPEICNLLREELARRMLPLISYVPYNEDYPALWDAVRIMTSEKIGNRYTLLERAQCNQKVMAGIESLPEEKRKELIGYAAQLHRIREQKKISIISCTEKDMLVKRGLITVLAFPLALPVALLNLPTLIAGSLCSHLLEDQGFTHGIRFAVKAVTWPIILIILAVVLSGYICPFAAWAIAIVLYPAPELLYSYFRQARLFISDIRYSREKKIQKLREEVIDLSSEKS